MKSKVASAFLCFMSVSVAGDAMHWFITPHPDASEARVWAVGAQLVLALTTAAISFWALWRTPATSQ